MPLSPQAEAFLDAVRSFRAAAIGAPQVELTPEQRRQGADAATLAMGTMPEGVEVSDPVDAGGVPAQWITPADAGDGVLLYLHGGGYVVGSMHTHTKLAAHLGVAMGTRVLNLDYRLAPEHPHPAAVTDALAAYRWLLESVPASRVVVSGDSAGGGLTMALLVAARDAGLPQPAAAVVLSPWVDLEGTGASMTTRADVDLLVDPLALSTMADLFVADGDRRDPLAAPLHAELHGLCPVYIQVGGHETLLDDATRLATKLAHADGQVRLDVFEQMQHVFQIAVGMIPEADHAVSRAGRWARMQLGN